MNACEKEKITSRDYPRVKTLDITQITSSGAVFNAEVFYNDDMDITDHGFVWGPSKARLFESTSLGSFKATGNFSFTGTYGMEAGKQIFVKAYLVTESYTVYGNLMEFTSQGTDPLIITDFNPKSASMWDTITISGQRFSSVSGNTVKFGDATATVTESTNEQIKVLVPTGLSSVSSIISVSTSGHTAETSTSFNLIVPEFTDFNPKTAYIGETISISGNNISPRNGPPNQVWFGDKRAVIMSATRNELVVEVPNYITSATEIIRVISFPTDMEFAENFQLGPPIIDYFFPTSGGPGELIAITGKGFHVIRDNNEVHIGGILLSLSSSNSTTIVGYLPTGLSTGDYKISVSTNGVTTESTDYFHYIAP